jgi:hypothetical protein
MKISISLLLFALLAAPFSAQTQQGQFNIFKSYANAKVKPIQYAGVSRKHAIGEYLDITQKKMMRYRKGRDAPNLMFNEKWNGNIRDNTNKGETRRLTKIVEPVTMPLNDYAANVRSCYHFLLLAIVTIAIMSIAMIRYFLEKNVKRPTANQDLEIMEESA